MTWVKLDDNMPQHPKMLRVGPDAAWLHVCGICYCARLLTDGLIPKAALPVLGGNAKAVAKLLAEGVWIDRDDAYEVAGYLDWNPSREKVEQERAAGRERQNRSRSRRVSRVTDGVSHSDPSHPIPSHELTTPLVTNGGLALEAVGLWIDREMQAEQQRGEVRSPAGLRKAIEARADWQRAESLAEQFPSLSVSELAGVLAGNVSILNQHRRSS